MKKIIASIALVVSLATLSLAQAAPAAPAAPEAKAQKPHRAKALDPAARKAERQEIRKEAGITDEDAAKLKAVHADSRQAAKAVKQDANLTPEQKEAKVEEIRDKRKAAVIAAIGSEKAERMREAHKARHPRKEK